MTIVLVEHKLEWIAAFSDRVIALNEGEISLEGYQSQVLRSPIINEIGSGVTRYTLAARMATIDKLWPEGILIPIASDDAAAGFNKDLHAH